MAFRAQFDGGKCGKCDNAIVKDDKVEFNSGNDLEHVDCVGTPSVEQVQVSWNTAESIQRQDLEDLELARVAPLGKQGACPTCFLELPVSGVCDDHGRVRVG